jgi:hypothetical protein
MYCNYSISTCTIYFNFLIFQDQNDIVTLYCEEWRLSIFFISVHLDALSCDTTQPYLIL